LLLKKSTLKILTGDSPGGETRPAGARGGGEGTQMGPFDKPRVPGKEGGRHRKGGSREKPWGKKGKNGLRSLGRNSVSGT